MRFFSLLLCALALSLPQLHAAVGDVQFGVVGERGSLVPKLVTPATSPSVFGKEGSILKSFTLGSGFTLTGSVLSVSGGGSGGASAWGEITGTLSSQTDLQTALNAKLSAATAAATYQPLNATLTAFSSLSNASGFLTNNGGGSLTYTGFSTGGLGTADNGLAAIFRSNGELDVTRMLRAISDSSDDVGSYTPNSISYTDGTHTLLLSLPALSADVNLVWPSASGTLVGTGDSGTVADAMLASGISASKLNVSSDALTFLGAANYAAMRTQLGLVISTNVQAYDADLTTYAGITPSANVQTLLGAANYAAFKTSLSLGTVADLSSITSAYITDGTIVNADISASAAIALSKLAVDPLARANHTGTQAASTITSIPEEIIVPCSTEDDGLTTGAPKVTFKMPCAMTLTAVYLDVLDAPTGSPIIVDIKEAGTSIFSTKPQVAVSATTSEGGAVPGVISDTSLALRGVITINVDQIGSGFPGTGLKVTLKGTR